jgi:conjugal transfer pilus assembly protein TraB
LIPNDKSGFLPAGSFATATLISGVEAFTGGTAQAQPQPVVIHLDANAVLPNAADYQIKGCHVLASVYGDMSSERVFGRLATLTCVDSKNRLVLSEEVEGNLIDSDGKNGIRGVLQDRQGAKLGRALLAGFAKGMGAAFGAAQSTTTATAAGLTSALTGDAFKASGYSGASTAANQLAEFYMKQAEATMPIIAVDAGRKISVLFTKSKALKFETINTYKIEPSKKLQVERR